MHCIILSYNVIVSSQATRKHTLYLTVLPTTATIQGRFLFLCVRACNIYGAMMSAMCQEEAISKMG